MTRVKLLRCAMGDYVIELGKIALEGTRENLLKDARIRDVFLEMQNKSAEKSG